MHYNYSVYLIYAYLSLADIIIYYKTVFFAGGGYNRGFSCTVVGNPKNIHTAAVCCASQSTGCWRHAHHWSRSRRFSMRLRPRPRPKPGRGCGGFRAPKPEAGCGGFRAPKPKPCNLTYIVGSGILYFTRLVESGAEFKLPLYSKPVVLGILP